MNLQQALKWADDNSQPEAVDRLRSRKAAQVLAMHIRRYRVWIKEQGEFSDTCTRAILGDVCEGCECKHKPSNARLCGCLQCLRDREEVVHGLPAELCTFIVCDTCGNKRCLHATDHRNHCTESNDVGQKGSAYAECKPHNV